MTKKDYELIAATLSRCRKYIYNEVDMPPNAESVYQEIIAEFVAALRKDNIRFNGSLFINACRKEGES